MIATLKIETSANCIVAALLSHAENRGSGLQRGMILDLVQLPCLITKSAGHSETAPSLTDASDHALDMLHHGQTNLRLPRLHRPVRRSFHPRPPAVCCEYIPIVREVY
jgi:hypothetical protein